MSDLEPSMNSADFELMFPNLLNFPGDRVFFRASILQKCCLVTPSGPAWLNTIF